VLALNYVLGKEQQSQKAVIEAVSDPSYPAHAVKVNGRIVAFEDAGKQKLAVEIFSNPNFGKDNFQGRELARKADDLLNTGEKYK
jgi:hypothetical protein